MVLFHSGDHVSGKTKLECSAVKRGPVGSTLQENSHCTEKLGTVIRVDPLETLTNWGLTGDVFFSVSCYSFEQLPKRFCCGYNEGRKTEPECDELPFTHLMLDSQMAKRADTLYAFPLLLLSLLPPVRTESTFPSFPSGLLWSK